MKKRIPLLAALLALVAALIVAPAVPQAAVAATPTTVATLPLVPGTGADPDIHTYNGKYYMLYNGDHSGAEVRMRVAASLSGLADGADISVWSPPPSMPDICCRVGWGGYLFPYGGHWYIYMQGDNGNQAQSRSFVVESATNDPLSTYSFKAYIPGVVNNNGYAAGPALVGSQLYMFQTYGERIWAAKASDPWTLTTGWTEINAPASSGWECAGGRCFNEGSNILVRGTKVYNIFSAGGYEDPNYCVGMMTATLGADLTLPGSWTESPGCVISRNDAVGSYGPGSMTWFKSPDGTQDWVAYHVKTTTATTFDGNDRRLMAKQVTWSGDTPVFGSPQAVGSTIALPSGDPGTVNAAPAVTSAATDSLALFTRTGDGQVRRSTWTVSGGWSGWTAMGDGGVRTIANPTAHSHTTNVIDLYTTRLDGSIAQTWTTGGAWSAWQTLGTPSGGATSAPSASTWGIDRQNVYVRGTGLNPSTNELSGRIYERWWSSGTGWSGWRDLGAPTGGALSAPAAVSRTFDRTDVFVRTAGNTIAVTRWDGANWSSWQNLGSAGGGIVSNLSAADWGADRIHVYGTARDGNVYERYWTTAGGWSTWQSLGAPSGGAASSPGVVSRANDLIDVFVRDGSGDIHRKTWNGTSWSGWSAITTP
ncbi:family 43 glycosylhydrolase [Herbiconiux moechotypicola]|uniref:PLL-like beta propeller domain-containing protein n=1 Tax=Herbiconiux moechotypicola TaxID=637393 RepID=A0ABN3DX73_9MICO|nr:family 43 glycosylhydrolase [Herbiconiux moechotypicola]MCS5730785.1 family 43 glycosylhydrolase [Herbiconiux moechotypicola]